MAYSCAYFAGPDDTLEAAQERKLDVICRKLRLNEGERLLDIGCGWGSLPIHAAAQFGVSAVGVTLSEPQAQLAGPASRRPASGTALRSGSRTTARSPTGRSTRSRASACTSTSGAPSWPATRTRS